MTDPEDMDCEDFLRRPPSLGRPSLSSLGMNISAHSEEKENSDPSMELHLSKSSDDASDDSTDYFSVASPRPTCLNTRSIACQTLGLLSPSQSRPMLEKNQSQIMSIKYGENKIPVMFINPFSPEGVNYLKNVKSGRNTDINENTDSNGIKLPFPSPLLVEMDTVRYKTEFLELCTLGRGYFGTVLKCVNRLNGCVYAIKKSNYPIETRIQDRMAKKEIQAHAVLDHPFIVKHYSSWCENGHLYIQNEYCNGGNLEKFFETNGPLPEVTLQTLILQMAQALSYMHGKSIAHLDIKPENIFLSIENEEQKYTENGITFKLGDFGHVAAFGTGRDQIEDGDSRYIAMEILNLDLSEMDKGDIFALGLSVYEVAGGGPMPKNGELWQSFREGRMKYLMDKNLYFNRVIEMMISKLPKNRPSADKLIGLASKLKTLIQESDEETSDSNTFGKESRGKNPGISGIVSTKPTLTSQVGEPARNKSNNSFGVNQSPNHMKNNLQNPLMEMKFSAKRSFPSPRPLRAKK